MKTQEKRGFRTFLTILIPCLIALLFSSASPSKKSVLMDLPIRDFVTVCHLGKSIRVDQSLVKSHLDHGDGLGQCAQPIRADQD